MVYLIRATLLAYGTALVVLAITESSFAQSAVEIQVGKGGVQDDYVCWGPTAARIRLVQPQSQAQQVQITTTKHDPVKDSGEVAFVDAPEGGLPFDQVHQKSEINIDLPSDGSWKSFYVVGTKASSGDKDVAIVVKDAQGAELTRYPLMVRVRKNAEKLTSKERDRFLSAFVQASNKNDQFSKYWGVHTDGIRLAHESAFMPWHRVFLINFERELQAEDPSVALPYWEFDKIAPLLFSKAFLGRVDSDQTGPDRTVVKFEVSNPLSRCRSTRCASASRQEWRRRH